MNRNIILFLLFFVFTISTINCQPQITDEITKIDNSTSAGEGFSMNFSLEKLENAEFYLTVELDLEEGNYFISPFSKDEVYGHFDIPFLKIII